MNLANLWGDHTSIARSSYQINGGGTSDGHGGRGEEHKKMMEEIANEVSEKRLQSVLSEIQNAAYAAAYAEFMKNLSFDVNTAVRIAFDNGKVILEDKKTQEVVAKNIMAEIEKQFRSMKK